MVGTMIAPDSKPGRLLKAMGEYQDQQHARTGDYVFPTTVSQDWEFHEQRSGLSRDEIRSCLPQLVAGGLAEALGKGKGMPVGYRASDGFASISAQGQRQLSEWAHPSPPMQIEIAGFGPQAQLQLEGLITYMSEHGITREDLDRFEDYLQDIVDNTESGSVETAANVSQLWTVFAGFVFPLLKNVAEA